MDTEKLNYDLPAELIAQKPSSARSASRMLVLNRSADILFDSTFSQICTFLRKGDCLTINNTKVIPARFLAKRKTGAEIEGLFIAEQENKWKVMLTKSSRLKVGESIDLLGRDNKPYCSAVVDTRLADGQWLIRPASPLAAEKILDNIGFAPLPPYIKRPQPASEHELDINRYQTVYAQQTGAIAAPTAGLHFTPGILEQIRVKGISIAQLTLHVGVGTFLPVKSETLEGHKIHSEEYSIDQENAAIINNAIEAGGRIIAVGTTTVRTLETAARGRKIIASKGQTSLFITPGFKFQVTDALITNFHLPKSTLLALVAAFAGLDQTLKAYKHAVEHKYRFYSYGDCMFII
jgi:S-adenosylmethionine:tRNA ribosyltransferase-isomerase